MDINIFHSLMDEWKASPHEFTWEIDIDQKLQNN
jgi:hypothetical protein